MWYCWVQNLTGIIQSWSIIFSENVSSTYSNHHSRVCRCYSKLKYIDGYSSAYLEYVNDEFARWQFKLKPNLTTALHKILLCLWGCTWYQNIQTKVSATRDLIVLNESILSFLVNYYSTILFCKIRNVAEKIFKNFHSEFFKIKTQMCICMPEIYDCEINLTQKLIFTGEIFPNLVFYSDTGMLTTKNCS